jgi:hypothetical protein
MRQHQKYQTICDYALTISHDMGVIHDIKRCETPMQKLKALIVFYDFAKDHPILGGLFSYWTTATICFII